MVEDFGKKVKLPCRDRCQTNWLCSWGFVYLEAPQHNDCNTGKSWVESHVAQEHPGSIINILSGQDDCAVYAKDPSDETDVTIHGITVGMVRDGYFQPIK